MPEAELLTILPVQLEIPVEKIVSRAGVRVNCETCGEEIINEREVRLNGHIFCQTCAYGGYYASDLLAILPASRPALHSIFP